MSEEYLIEFKVDSQQDEWETYDIFENENDARKRIEEIRSGMFITHLRLRKRLVTDWETIYESDEKEVRP